MKDFKCKHCQAKIGTTDGQRLCLKSSDNKPVTLLQNVVSLNCGECGKANHWRKSKGG